MIRKTFIISVNSGYEQEYERRHSSIWPKLEAALKTHGVRNYSIFLHPETRQLFAYVEIDDEARWSAIAKTAECAEWWAYMREFMSYNADSTPVTASLRKVFHLE